MNNRVNDERCMSTSSTVSGIYSNFLPSPAPVCMFYFAHPFGGIATPSSTSYTIDPYAGMPTARNKTPNIKQTSTSTSNHTHQQHLNDFTPWPRQTWQTKDVLSPLIQALQRQIGQNISEFEKVLRQIRELWYSPQTNSNIADIQYLHNYYTFVQRQKQFNEQNFDYILNWQENLNPLNYAHLMESNAFATNQMMMTQSNRRIDKQTVKMAFGNTMQQNNAKKPHTRLLRRRHSLPETIMRKHQLATQKHVFSDMNVTATAPSPPARERVPPSFESRERTQTSSSYSSLGSSASTIVANGFASSGSTGSDPNLNRMFPSSGSMRQQLLRRLWHKEYRRFNRTGSLSPPLHRSLRTKRTLKLQDTSPDVCLECQRLEETHFNRSVPEINIKHTKHSTGLTTSKTSSFAFARKSFSIETETMNERSMLTLSSASNDMHSSQPNQSLQSTGSNNELEVSKDVDILNHVNGNFMSQDEINGNDSTQKIGDRSFFIEMEGDRINVTTVAMAESTGLSDSTLQVSSRETSSQQQEALSESAASQSSNQWHLSSNDRINNNGENDTKSKITEIGRMHGGVYDAYHMSSGEIDLENESVVRLKTHEPLDQNTIDTIISQILVDSLNNIIVVQGKGQQNESHGDNGINHTQTDYITPNESASNTSSLPLPVTDQIYFPHYLSTETLSEYSTKLSDNSNAIDLLPSNLVISVLSGSTYPGDGGEMIVHRMTDIPRTESMEVQPASAPSVHGDDMNGNHIDEPTVAQIDTTPDENDDDATSLVDSLDDPNEMVNECDPETTPNQLKASVEKGHAFFVPIENTESSVETVPSPVQSAEFHLNAAIANTMPDRIRERLEKRQMEIIERKETEAKRRQEKIQKLISQNVNSRSSSDSKPNSSSFEVIPDDSPTNVKEPNRKSIAKKPNNKQLQSNIGLLESYTVDAQGNLKFIEGGKKSGASKKVTTIAGPVVKHVAIKKTITTKKPLTTLKMSRDSVASVSNKNQSEKRTKVATNNSIRNRSKERVVSQKAIRDVQKMTLGQHSPSDMITPDRDCGPRRMYQKTEIREGAKRIEILEIVECLNSSSDSLTQSQSTSSASPPVDVSPSQSLIERFSAKHTSKIPIPVLSKNRSRNRGHLNGNQQRTLKAQIRDSVAGVNANNSKVDQIIADLLIEALNHSTDIGIEFIKTPQHPSSSQSNIKLNNTKRMNISTRRTNGMTISGVGSSGSGKRSSHGSAKYQQVFDAIPEEKSGSVSFDSSPNDENGSPVNRSSNNSSTNPTSDDLKVIHEKTELSAKEHQINSGSSPKRSVTDTSTKVASGKAAIESDQDKSETWFGCFGRTHIDSPVDGLLIDEVGPSSEVKASPRATTSAASSTVDQLIVSHSIVKADSNRVMSTVSSNETKDSVMTSIPSEAPIRDVSTVGSDSILPLIEETFESSVTANHGGDAAKEKPFRKHARCSAQNHFNRPCSECKRIENNLQDNSVMIENKPIEPKPSDDDEKLHLLSVKPVSLSTSNENVWQVSHTDKYDTTGKFMLSPITVCSAQDASPLTNGRNLKFGVDSTSFIVLRDENENASHFLPNITNNNESGQNGMLIDTNQAKIQNKFERPCEDCCFCNPTLHYKRRNGNEQSPKRCNFCSSRQQSTQTTPATSTRYPEKSQSINNDTEATSRTSASVERIYESKFRSNHTHIRTHSKDSDSVNTQCTKKTNKKVRKTLLNGSDERLNGNHEPSARNQPDDLNGNEVNGNKTETTSKQKSSIPKLPPATNHEWIANSMDSATSPTSSNSTGSSRKSRRKHDSKSVPNLPRTERWQTTEPSPNAKPQKTRQNSRYQNFYGNGKNSATDERTAVTSSESKSKSKPTGWTVTVAGTYSDDMAPDVQMHLSFPKRSSSQSKKLDKSTHMQQSIDVAKDTEPELDSNSNYKDTDSQKFTVKQPAILPPPTPQSIKLNPKRSLTKNYFNTDILQQQQQHSQLVAHRKLSYDNNGNANIFQHRSAKEYCNLPHIIDQRLNDQANRIIAKQTAKKTIKRSEYSVSVASATTTTRTISNFANGKRAMSIQALNANSCHRFPNAGRRRNYGRCNHSMDTGQLTYRLSATPSPLPSSSFYSPTTIGYGDETDRNGNHKAHLSVFGNAIAPERKPPVPTMSERDVTRRHDACFTRTRSIFL